MNSGKFDAGKQNLESTVDERQPNKTERGDRTEKTDIRESVLLYLHDLIFLLCGVLIIFLLFFRIVVVSGTSMNDTLLDGDYLLLVSNSLYKNPKAGDIIVASKDSFEDGEPIVKRVIATEGQVVSIDFVKGIVYVDGVAIEEPYIKMLTTTYGGTDFPITVDEGCVFVMGDNRDVSRDSRYPEIGQIDTREILGKAIFLFLPGTNRGNTERDFERIGVLSNG